MELASSSMRSCPPSPRSIVISVIRPRRSRSHGLQHVRDAVAVLETKATPDEVNDYRGFVLTLSDHVANAHREDGMAVSGGEQAVIADIKAALGG